MRSQSGPLPFLLPLLLTPAAANPNVIINGVIPSFRWINPFGADPHPAGYKPICTAESTFRAYQHTVDHLNEPLPLGLAPWADAVRYFFGGRPYPGTWDGVDPEGTMREIMRMEYADVPAAVREWIAAQARDKEGDSRYMFGVYEKPTGEEGKVARLADLSVGEDTDKIVLFAAGALYDILPLWVAEGSECKETLLDLTKYKPNPEDESVVAWPVTRTYPSEEDAAMEFTIRAQFVHELEEGKKARLQREEEERELLEKQKLEEGEENAEEDRVEADSSKETREVAKDEL